MSLFAAVLLVLIPGVPLHEQLPSLHIDMEYELEIIKELLEVEYVPEPEPLPPPPEPKPEPPPQQPQQTTRNVWDRLADCESGNWIDGGASFETGSARWWWGDPNNPIPPWGTRIHHGGLQFHPDTWDWLKPNGYPRYAYQATREQQIVVAERVLEVQGWRAWPTCSKKLSLR